MARRPAAVAAPAALAIEYRPLASLVPYAANSRTHTPEQVLAIRRSMTEFGWTNPVLLAEDGSIIAGHARAQAAALAPAIDPVPCIVLGHLSAEQRRALVIADNQLAIAGAGWNLDLLRSEIAGLREVGFDIAVLGFGSADLASLFNRGGGLTDPDAAPPVPAVATSALGDAWCLGRHRLVCGDATNREHVALCLAGPEPRLMVTDPPYGVNYDADWRVRAGIGGAGSATGVVTNDDRADWSAAWALFPGSVAYVWHGGLHSGLVQQSLASCGLLVRAQIVWVKTRPVIGRGAYHWQHEPLLYVVRPDEADGWARFVDEHEVAAYSVRRGQTAKWEGGRKQSTVWFIEHLKSDTGHSTQKPVECMRRPIENNSRAGETVYDPFCGSGTSLIAAEMAARDGRALEIDPGYCDVGVLRWQAFTGAQAVLAATGETFDEVRQRRTVAVAPRSRRKAAAR